MFITTQTDTRSCVAKKVGVCYTAQRYQDAHIPAGVVELVYTYDSKSYAARLMGSSPISGTEIKARPCVGRFILVMGLESRSGARQGREQYIFSEPSEHKIIDS